MSMFIILFIVALIIVSAVVILEYRFASKEHIIFGLIPIIFIAGIFCTLYFSSLYFMSNTTVIQDKCKVSDGYYAKITIRTDGNGNVISFSPIEIRESSGSLVYNLDIDLDSDYQDEDAEYYENAINYFTDKYNLSGKRSADSVDAVKKDIILTKDHTIVYFAPSTILIILLVYELPIIVLFFLCKIKIRYSRLREEMRKLEIELEM